MNLPSALQNSALILTANFASQDRFMMPPPTGRLGVFRTLPRPRRHPRRHPHHRPRHLLRPHPPGHPAWRVRIWMRARGHVKTARLVPITTRKDMLLRANRVPPKRLPRRLCWTTRVPSHPVNVATSNPLAFGSWRTWAVSVPTRRLPGHWPNQMRYRKV